jgi:hypothetical protein
MEMHTNLQGRLRNTSLTPSNGLLPLFEAVVNSIEAIEDRDLPPAKGKVDVEVIRDTRQMPLPLDTSDRPVESIIGFNVIDNGIGFTDANMDSFATLDSDQKAARGGKGIGRLLWLKAFEEVRVESVFNGIGPKKRSFVFNAESGIEMESTQEATKEESPYSIVHLSGFLPEYRERVVKTSRAIARAVVEHCLWYFIREGGAPNISIIDGKEKLSLLDIYEDHMHSSAVREQVEIKGQEFDLLHMKLRSNSAGTHTISFCADGRLVQEEKLAGRIPGLHGRVHDDNGDFWYSCYVSSTFLDRRARSDRTDFVLKESAKGDLFEEADIGLEDIRDTVVNRARSHLGPYLSVSIEKTRDRIHSFVTRKAPRYRPVLSRIPQDSLDMIDPGISDKELELALHKQLAEIEANLLEEGHDLMRPDQDESDDEYLARLSDYLKKASDIKKSDLANYVAHRRAVLDLLDNAIKKQKNGKYVLEGVIHRLIMPMRVESGELLLDNCNLWMVDERLAFHDYLASDKSLRSMPITGSTERKEPDLCALNIFDNPVLTSEGSGLPLASITIVEIKRPRRDGAKAGEGADPIEQAISYLTRVREGHVTTARGRPIPKSEDIPGFCYVLCDLTASIRKRCEQVHDLISTSDCLGYFGYKKNAKAYVEVISFDRLKNLAMERNRAFFDKLGLPTT